MTIDIFLHFPPHILYQTLCGRRRRRDNLSDGATTRLTSHQTINRLSSESCSRYAISELICRLFLLIDWKHTMHSEADRVIIFYKASKTHLPNLIRSIISVCINWLSLGVGDAMIRPGGGGMAIAIRDLLGMKLSMWASGLKVLTAYNHPDFYRSIHVSPKDNFNWIASAISSFNWCKWYKCRVEVF